MEKLQTLCCLQYLKDSAKGSLILHADIPGSTRHWLRAWCLLLKKVCQHGDVLDMVIECIETGSSARIQADNMFRRKVHVLSESLGLHHQSPKSGRKRKKRINYADMTITRPSGWSWRVPDLEQEARKDVQNDVPKRTLDQEYPQVRKMVEENLCLIDGCEDWEDKKEKILWDGIALAIKWLPKRMRAECVKRLVLDGVLEEGYELW